MSKIRVSNEVSECKERVIRAAFAMQFNSANCLRLDDIVRSICEFAPIASDDETYIDIADILVVMDKMMEEGELSVETICAHKKYKEKYSVMNTQMLLYDMINGTCGSNYLTTSYSFSGYVGIESYYCREEVIEKMIRTGKNLKNLGNPITLKNLLYYYNKTHYNELDALTKRLVIEEDISKDEFKYYFDSTRRTSYNYNFDSDDLEAFLSDISSYIKKFGDNDIYMEVIMDCIEEVFKDFCTNGNSRKTGIRKFMKYKTKDTCDITYNKIKAFNEKKPYKFFEKFDKYFNEIIVEELMD